MTARRAPQGSITTFFSYKGGVGRTMALANAGFLAAMAGQRVLLMDWDLEAPGLAYYFRGMTDHETAGAIRNAPGVLNLLWRWVAGIEEAADVDNLENHFRPFREGQAFAECAKPLIHAAHLPKGARLDFIGAGSAAIEECETSAYADALARFGWGDFFEVNAGGALIEALRGWCRSHYDVILIDSRTGLNDVAGICTMQLPDTIVLCFVLNRQNIEGVAQVAAAVKEARGDEIAIRMAPMRVSRDRPIEEADARARAQRQFERAGLEAEDVEADMEQLSVPVATVPFYETLAPFVPADPGLDPLTLCYQQLTEILTGAESKRLKIDPAWRDDVRRRLEPKLSTVEYLASLEGAEPSRAREEIERFVLGALDADPVLELDADYVRALVEAALSVQDIDWDGDAAQAKRIGDNAIALLRRLVAFGEGDWRLQLVDALQEYDLQFGLRVDSPYAEFEEILAQGPQTLAILNRRIAVLLAHARSYLPDSPDIALGTTDGAREILKKMPAGDHDDRALIILNDVEIADVRVLALKDSKPEEARREAERALELLGHVPPSNRSQALAAGFHMHLAPMAPPDEAAMHVLAAARAWPRAISIDTANYKLAVDVLLEGNKTGEKAVEFIDLLFNRGKLGSSVRMRSAGTPLQFSNATEDFVQFAKVNERLAGAIGELGSKKAADPLGLIADLSAHGLLRRMRRRPVRTSSRSGNDTILKRYARLYDMLASYGAAESPLKQFGRALGEFDRWRTETAE